MGQYTKLQNALAQNGIAANLIGDPGSSSDPSIAISMLLIGISDNLFTGVSGKTFESYWNGKTYDYYNARDLVNGDKGNARKFIPEGKNTQGITSGSYIAALANKVQVAIQHNPYCGW